MKDTLSNDDHIAQLPCIRNCCLNEADICLGCFRSLEEIKRWGGATNEERIVFLQNARRRREASTIVSSPNHLPQRK